MNYIIYDLEATCWEIPPPGYVQEIIEIGAYKINEYGEVRGKFSRFVKPSLHPNLSVFCKELTNITQQDINKANIFPIVIEEFMNWGRIEEEDYMLCSWGNFDRKQFAYDCKLHRIDSGWTERHVNLKEQYRILRNMRSGMGLKKAIEKEGILFTGQHHRGISDAENLVKLFLKFLGSWSL
jgi:inhibitor of KinA sporulation pathway (predicted exonuclease)